MYAQSDTTFFAGVRDLQKMFDETNYQPIQFQDTSLAIIDNISKDEVHQPRLTDQFILKNKKN